MMFGDKNEHDSNSDNETVDYFGNDSDNESLGNKMIMILMMLTALMVPDDEEHNNLQAPNKLHI